MIGPISSLLSPEMVEKPDMRVAGTLQAKG